MPKTVLRLTEAELIKVAFLGIPVEALLSRLHADTDLIARIHETQRWGFRSRISKKARERFLQTVNKQLEAEPCTVGEALQTKEVFERITGLKRHRHQTKMSEEENTWHTHSSHLFTKWLQDYELEQFQSWDNYPTHLAAYYHLSEYGSHDLCSLRFDTTLVLALLYEVLHREGIRTLGALAALSVPQLYGYIKQSHHDNEDFSFQAVRAFLRYYHLSLETVIDEEAATASP